MRSLLVVALVFTGVCVAWGDGLATQPYVAVDDIPVPAARTGAIAAGPATQPAAAGVADGSVVAILPFESLGDVLNRDWTSRAVQESLEADVARLGGVSSVTVASPPGPIDSQAARDAARTAGGDIVVFGAEQFSGDAVRFTAQVVDVKTGAAMAGLKASGDFRDLFELEDELAGQLSRALRPPPPAVVASKDDSLILTQPVVALRDDPYAIATNSALADAYNRYYFDWNDYQAYSYGGIGGFYSGIGGFYGGYFPYGLRGINIVAGHGGHGRR